MPDTKPSARTRPWPDYRAVWRWHFYAGLLCIPIVVFLSITGAIYLFKPQVEAAIDHGINHRPAAQVHTPSEAVGAALTAHPGWSLHAYQLPTGPSAAAQIVLGRNGGERRVVVDRADLKILRDAPEDAQLMRMISHLHGELMLGDRGSNLVELAASWAIVLILTGLYLWWPRSTISLAGVLYPRLGAGSRLLLRDLHAVTAVWVSAFTLFLLVTGLPWAKNWGGYLKEIRKLTGTAVAVQDWPTGRSSEVAANRARDRAMPGMSGMSGMSRDTARPHQDHGGAGEHHGGGGGRRRADVVLSAEQLRGLDRIVPSVDRLQLAYPVMISPPARSDGAWSAKSDAANRTLREDLTLDPASGTVLTRKTFGERHVIDRMVGIGVSVHEGQLFGWANQLLNLLVAAGLSIASLSAATLWWRQRARGVLGAPLPKGPPRFSWGLVAIVLLLAALLPEFGVSLVAVLAVERLLLRRIPVAARWLGLREAAEPAR
jgi:uncharacterized iron-regulated membrane protein